METLRKKEGDRLTLAITGKCTVEHAVALREALLGAVAAGGDLALDISGVDEVDVTFLQLMLATAQTLSREGRSLGRHGPASEACLQAAHVSGFDQTPVLKTFFADGVGDG
ncbi:MAG: STAS domain-containing protein [Solidesulfovibrio sp.]|jgi:anti-anti-sigma regulatory factor|uniref:STAS domain-containing protein n=1 Tax=Solidesulfovibrio sp. TaxID=2910990 RepID=UPI002B1FB9F5|nr:STAS domain-containing protein [Solidesulfovibrio sp.]MEA4858678.1 STAS domain-containing protein [Solidesulfovibrio sp.]